MAREIVYLDDLTGEHGAEPVKIGWQDVWFEVDLAEANRTELTEYIEKFINAGRPVSDATGGPEPARRTRRPRGEGAASSGEKIDYGTLEHAGTPHRGRTTEAEAELVRNNLDEINERLKAGGHPEIDPNDEKAKKRYGF